ncbi:hypothetical protein Bca4012_101065 [Brassica carinata]|uniref:DUF8040 domain-containing protein n=1 Tax=Brassica carinata TaxID=52824 RepID=A0A8X7TSX8_BRACI|nr:hypothetical protein Bca52824_083561 [Brassica carinata]
MSSSRNNSGSRRGRQSCGEARTTTDGGTTREGQYLWKDKNCEVMLELVITELKAVEKSSWDPEINRKIGYLSKLWNIHGQLVKRTGVAVDPSSGQIDMMETWWSDRIAQVQPALDVDGITMVDQMQETQTAEQIVDLTSDQGCNRSIRSMSSSRRLRFLEIFYYISFDFKNLVLVFTDILVKPMNKDWGNGWKMIRGQIYHNEVSCRTLIRMSSEAFIRLCEVLQTKYGLQESNNIKVDESVAIFLILCGQTKFHYVLGAVVQLAVDYLRPRTTREFEAISNSLHGDKRYSPYFNGFVGALDGTHVPVMVTPGRDALRFVNRKGTASLNVLGIYIDFKEFDVGRDTTHSHSNVNNHSDDETYMKIVRDHIAEQIWTDKRHASRRL